MYHALAVVNCRVQVVGAWNSWAVRQIEAGGRLACKEYPLTAMYIDGLVVGNPKTGLPNHQTALPSISSTGNALYYYLSRENTEDK